MKHLTRPLLALALVSACKPSATAQTPPDAPATASDAGPRNARDASTGDASAAGGEVSARLESFGSVEALQAWWRAHRGPRNRGGGNMNGDAVGDAFGYGGVGLGGGGAGEGTIGLGSVGTIGHGAGTGTGSGYGSGAGAPLGRSAAPRRATGPANAPANAPGTRIQNSPGDPNSITNNQEEGVDEGDIVKMHGNHLVILRRGRLFTVGLGDDSLRPISMTEAYGRGRTPGGWYDEMLIDGDTVVVIGYSYAAQASEVGLFDINAEGQLRWRDTVFVRSSDYYSSRNYASRLVGHRLVMYMPVPLRGDASSLSLPAVRHRPEGDWQTVLNFSRLYKPVQALGHAPVIHTVLSCDLSQRTFACEAVGVVGPTGRNFYVSGRAVYLWVAAPPETLRGRGANPAPTPATVYRLPLDCSGAGAVRARGVPIDQFSFDEAGDQLRVLLRADGQGDGMWGAENSSGDMGFVRIATSRFGDDVPAMTREAYRPLPRAEGVQYDMHNRFVGDHVIYSAGRARTYGRNRPAPNDSANPVVIYDAAHDRVTTLTVPHSAERIEPLGRDVLVVGNQGTSLTFTAIALDETPALAGNHSIRNAAQGESRSHGFFFRPSGDRSGMLGLPITRGDDSGTSLTNVSSAVQFLTVNNLRFADGGGLASRSASVSDHCVASCADWYGNARPIFWGDRTFALLGYEVVEGAVSAGRVRERRRVDVFRALQGQQGDQRRNAFDNVED
ncbi:MAG: beta-propeller domain-containing protein [Myxococcales bacterium]|nr:beta-propeller domain-containing protein [Myxococcales bacterium]